VGLWANTNKAGGKPVKMTSGLLAGGFRNDKLVGATAVIFAYGNI
jgi:hypothetical protein